MASIKRGTFWLAFSCSGRIRRHVVRVCLCETVRTEHVQARYAVEVTHVLAAALGNAVLEVWVSLHLQFYTEEKSESRKWQVPSIWRRCLKEPDELIVNSTFITFTLNSMFSFYQFKSPRGSNILQHCLTISLAQQSHSTACWFRLVDGQTATRKCNYL